MTEGWLNREYLPRSGANDGKKLDKFIEKGLGNGKEFSRTQVNSKFRHWKASYEIEKVVTLVDITKIYPACQIIKKIQNLDIYKLAGQRTVVPHSKDPKMPTQCSIIDSLRAEAVVELLRTATIESINEALSTKTKQSEKYAEAEKGNIAAFQDNWLVAVQEAAQDSTDTAFGNGSTRSRVKSYAYTLAVELIRQIHIHVKVGDEESLDAKVKKILEECSHGENVIPIGMLHKETLYYIAGWLLFAARKEGQRRADGSCLQQSLSRLADEAHVMGEHTELATLPTAKIERTQLYEERLHCPSMDFFEFVSTVEHVCEALLIQQSLILYGPDLINDLSKILREETALTNLVNNCVSGLCPDCLEETTGYLVSTYMNMRGKDFVRQIVGASKKSLAVGHRQEIATLSNAEHRPKQGFNGQNRSFKPVCFFCQGDHFATKCEKVSTPPGAGEAHTREIPEPGRPNTTTTWHWCTECKLWRVHTTDEHIIENNDDAREDSDEMTDVIDGIPRLDE